MPIVITPTGQFVDSATGNPVDLPPQRPELPMRSRTGEVMQDPNLRNLNIPPMSQQELQNMLTDPNMGMEGEMARENIPANRDMGMNSMMPQTMGQRTGAALTPEEMQMQQAQQMSGSAISEQEAMAMNQGQGSAMSIEEKLDILMRMGLSQDEAIEAVALENSLPATDPSEFGGARAPNPGMGALSGVPAEGMMQPPMQRQTRRPMTLEEMRMEGRDRSYNPMDAINPYNAPNT